MSDHLFFRDLISTLQEGCVECELLLLELNCIGTNSTIFVMTAGLKLLYRQCKMGSHRSPVVQAASTPFDRRQGGRRTPFAPERESESLVTVAQLFR
jgi:hypothetical protein